MTVLACAQALLLDYAPHRTLCIVAQAAAPLLDTRRTPPLPRHIAALQCLLHAASLLLPAYAFRQNPQYGGSAMNALVKALAPILCLLLQWRASRMQIYASVVSYLGFLIASWPSDGEWRTDLLSAQALLFGGTLCGVLLGLTQQRYGVCWFEMSLGAAALCALTIEWRDITDLSFVSIAAALAFGALSFAVQAAVRDYSEMVEHDAFRLSMALNERRACTILMGAAGSDGPVKLICGAAVALAGVQAVERSGGKE